MQRLLHALISFAGCLQTYAFTDDTPHASPDGRFALYNVGDTADADHYFEIRAKDGAVVYSSQKSGDFEFGTYANAIRWTPDSQFALFWVHHAKIDSTCIFSADDRKLKHLESDEVDSWTVPMRWASTRTFVVEISGPHGHNVRMDCWHYSKTYRVTSHPFRLECIYTTRTIHNDKVSFPDISRSSTKAPNQSGLVLTVGGKAGGASIPSGVEPFGKIRTATLRQAQDHGKPGRVKYTFSLTHFSLHQSPAQATVSKE